MNELPRNIKKIVRDYTDAEILHWWETVGTYFVVCGTPRWNKTYNLYFLRVKENFKNGFTLFEDSSKELKAVK